MSLPEGTRVVDAPPPRQRTWPVVELFGPTIQGEGPATGERCWFLRLGGCDYRCDWCDSMHAVDPAEVRKAPRMTAEAIHDGLLDLGFRASDQHLLILSGGNPALHHLAPLLDELAGARLHVETQGTVWRPWLDHTSLVVVSPKPPSAFRAEAEPLDAAMRGVAAAAKFTAKLAGAVPWALKVVAFDCHDLAWAKRAHNLLAGHSRPFDVDKPVGCYLSAGTAQGGSPDAMVTAVLEKYRWLCTEYLARPELAPYRLGAQMHVLAWPGELER